MTHGGAIRYCTLSGTLPPQIRTAALFIPEIAANAESRPRAAPLRCVGAHCTAAPIAFPRRRSRLSVPFPLPTSGSDGRASFAAHGLGHDIRRWPVAACCTQRRLRRVLSGATAGSRITSCKSGRSASTASPQTTTCALRLAPAQTSRVQHAMWKRQRNAQSTRRARAGHAQSSHRVQT